MVPNDSLSKSDFIKILNEPKNALTKQYKALLGTEGIDIEFTEDSILEISQIAENLNSSSENIRARRLHTIIEKVMEDISFEASDVGSGKVKIDSKYVLDKVKDIAEDTDLSRYIL